MKKILLLVCILFGFNILAMDPALLEGIDRGQIKGSLDRLVQQGVFTKEQAEAAKKQLDDMNDKQVEELKGKAARQVGSGGALPLNKVQQDK